MKKVAFVFFNIPSTLGGGGAERQFSDAYEFYQKRVNNRVELFFFIDQISLTNLKSINKLLETKNVIVIPSFLKFPKYFRIFLINIFLMFKLVKHKINLLHIPMPDITYIPTLLILKIFYKIKLVFNATDCTIVHTFDSLPLKHPYKLYIKYINFNGVYSWYIKFSDVFSKIGKLQKNQTPIICAQYCFANLNLYKPAQKYKHIVWAARFVDVKNPMMFIEAIKIFKKNYIKHTKEWKFFIFGEGPMKHAIKNKISEYNLIDILEMKYSNSMHEIFPHTKLFISTQDFENFTSLSMIEAMASGNAIIARNVGQTDYFVKHNLNGFILEEDTPENLAKMINKYIEHSEMHDEMELTSIKIATETHTVANFVTEIEEFWIKILKG